MTTQYVMQEQREGDTIVIYTVGFFDPNGRWHPESDHHHRDDALSRVHYLNGGKQEEEELEERVVVTFTNAVGEYSASVTIGIPVKQFGIYGKASVLKLVQEIRNLGLDFETEEEIEI